MPCLKAVVEFHNKGMFDLLTNFLFIENNGLFLIIKDELLGHNLHRIELPIPQTPHQIHLTKPPNRQTLQNLIFLQRPIPLMFQTPKIHRPIQYPIPQRHPIIQQNIPIHRLKPNGLRHFDYSLRFILRALIVVELLVEEVFEVFGLDVEGELDGELSVFVVEV